MAKDITITEAKDLAISLGLHEAYPIAFNQCFSDDGAYKAPELLKTKAAELAQATLNLKTNPEDWTVKDRAEKLEAFLAKTFRLEASKAL